MKDLFGTRFRDVSHFVDSKKLPPNGPAGSLGDTVVHLHCRDLRLGNNVSVFDNVEDAWNSATYGGAYQLVNEDPQKFVLISNDGGKLDIEHGNIDPDVDNVFVMVNNGQNHTYHYEISGDHAPGTHWYHSHLHGTSGSGSQSRTVRMSRAQLSDFES